MNMRVLYLALFAGCVLAATPERLQAQAGNYPTRPITLIVPFAPGGATDIVARIISLKLGRDLGQNLVVENRTGAGGNIGAAAAAKADPDGHTLALMTTGNVVINPFLYKTMPLDPFTDLVPVAVVADGPEVIAVNAALGVNNLREFIEAARAKSGTFTYGSAGTGTIPHLGGDLLARLIGTKMVHVPFRGSAAAMKEVATGEIQFSIATHASAEPFVAAGKVKILAVAHPRRLSSLPDIPTTAEAGLAGFELSNWFGVMAPRGTSPDIIALLNAKLQSMFDDPANVALLTRQGIEPVRDTAQGFAARIAKEAKVWKEIVAGSGLQLE